MSQLIILLMAAQFPGTADAPLQTKKTKPPFTAKIAGIKQSMSDISEQLSRKYQAAPEDKRAAVLVEITKAYLQKTGPLMKKALEAVKPHVKSQAAVEVLAWIITSRFESTTAAEAADLLERHHLEHDRTFAIGKQFVATPMPWTEKLLRALSTSELPKQKRAEATLALADALKTKAEMPGALEFYDRKMLQQMELRFGKKYLAELRKLNPAKIEKKASALYQKVIDKYGFVRSGITSYAELARRRLFELKNLTIGKKAPDIRGEDIDGVKFKLSDYRGKVVVLEFWGNW